MWRIEGAFALAVTVGASIQTAAEAVVDPTGRVACAWVTRPLFPSVDLEARNTALRWEFKPGMEDGKPVHVLVTIILAFGR